MKSDLLNDLMYSDKFLLVFSLAESDVLILDDSMSVLRLDLS